MQRTPTQGSKLKLSTKNGVNTKHKKNESVSTPVPNHVDSPPGMADSPSPIPFLCTQEESDVVWNYYSPSSDNGSPTHTSNTPTTRKRKKVFYYNDFSPVTRMPTKKKFIRPAIKNMEFLKGLKEELTALNQNLINKAKNKKNDKTTPTTESHASPNSSIFENSSEDIFTSETQCVLRKITTGTSTPQRSHSITDFEDSMNEILIKATQHIEENVNINIQCSKSQFSNKFKIESPKIVNDSLDNLLGNMNDSEIEILASQAPVKATNDSKIVKSDNKLSIEKPQSRNTRSSSKANALDGWNDDGDSIFNNIPDLSCLVSSSIQNESKSKFMRHNSMPESPNHVPQMKKNQFSGKTFSRHISMPVSGAKMVVNSEEFSQVIRCTPEDIKRKHEAAKEKLMAKKLDPLAKKSPQAFYGQNKSNPKTPTVTSNVNSTRGQPLRTVSSNNIQSRYNSVSNSTCHNNNNLTNVEVNKKTSIQEQIEKKRQDALLKLQRNRTLGAKK